MSTKYVKKWSQINDKTERDVNWQKVDRISRVFLVEESCDFLPKSEERYSNKNHSVTSFLKERRN